MTLPAAPPPSPLWDSSPDVEAKAVCRPYHEAPVAIARVWCTYSMHQMLEEMDLERGIQLVTLNDHGYNAPF